MNIASITSSYPRYPGDGVGSFVHSLLSTLSSQGHQVNVLAPYDPKSSREWLAQWKVKPVGFIWPKKWSLLGHSRSLIGDLTLKWHAYPLVLLFTFFAFFHLLHLVKQSRAQVIYAHWLIPGGLIGAMVARVTKTPLVISLHGSDVYVAERYLFLKPFISFIFKSVCQVTACSKDLANRVIKMGLLPEKVSVIPYGVDTELFRPDTHSAQKAKKKLSPPNSHKIVLALGRLVHKKGFAYFIRSIPIILSSHPNTLFIIGGEGDLRLELQELVDSLKIQSHFRFLEHIPWQETRDYLTLADIIVVPSIIDVAGNVDGLPNVVLEAMSTGCAIVASEVAGIPDVIQHNQNGLLVPPRDEKALSSAIITLLTNSGLRNQLRAAARLSAVSNLSWFTISQRIIRIFEKCLS